MHDYPKGFEPKGLKDRPEIEDDPSREVWTVSDVAEYFHIHPSTVYQLVRSGSLPSFRVGESYRFRRDVIERWQREQTINDHKKGETR